MYFIISLFTRLSVPALNLLAGYRDIKKTEAVSQTFLDILKNTKTDKVFSPSSHFSCANESAVVFNNVHFTYANGKTKKDQNKDLPVPERETKKEQVLQKCSFHLPNNKINLIVGPSGCGKTTIAKLILGFWKIQEGNICILGKDINDYLPLDLRLKISYVSQGEHIIEESIWDNLMWSFSPDQIACMQKYKEFSVLYEAGKIQDHQLLKQMHELREIKKSIEKEMLQVLTEVKLPQQLKKTDDVLSLEAKELSGGQQQRLSIARMMLDRSPLLILDEPLTGVDVFTVNELLPSLLKSFRNGEKTVIIISHKLLFVKYAQHVVVLNDDCTIAEEGSPATLLNKPTGRLNRLLKEAQDQLNFESIIGRE